MSFKFGCRRLLTLIDQPENRTRVPADSSSERTTWLTRWFDWLREARLMKTFRLLRGHADLYERLSFPGRYAAIGKAHSSLFFLGKNESGAIFPKKRETTPTTTPPSKIRQASFRPVHTAAGSLRRCSRVCFRRAFLMAGGKRNTAVSYCDASLFHFRRSAKRPPIGHGSSSALKTVQPESQTSRFRFYQNWLAP